MILAVDPGSEQSGMVSYDIVSGKIHWVRVVPNGEALEFFIHGPLAAYDRVVIEYPVVRGQMMKSQVIETIFWIGRFAQAWNDMDTFIRFDRREVAKRLCGRGAVKDKQVRRALIARFPATGGGSEPAIGTKVDPGPLYGVKTHCWAALGVAVAYADRLEEMSHDDIFGR